VRDLRALRGYRINGMTKRIALDIDSTLHPHWDQFSDAVRRRFGVTLRYEDQLTWDVSQLRPEQVRASVAETHREAHVMAAAPYPGAVEAVRRWHAAGHFIHVTSHREADCSRYTQRWLETIGLPFDELYCSQDKLARCRAIGIDVLIDDSPVNLAQALDAGITAATLLHPWNRELCETEDVVCGEHWDELAANLEPLLAR